MGVAHGVRHARKHLAAYADDAVASGCAPDADERRQLPTESDPTRVLQALERLFSSGEWAQRPEPREEVAFEMSLRSRITRWARTSFRSIRSNCRR